MKRFERLRRREVKQRREEIFSLFFINVIRKLQNVIWIEASSSST